MTSAQVVQTYMQSGLYHAITASEKARLRLGMARSRKMTANVAPRKRPATTSAGWCRLSTTREPAIAHARHTYVRSAWISLDKRCHGALLDLGTQ